MTATRRKAVAAFRRRAKKRGLARVEIMAREDDARLLRDLARRLGDPAEGAAMRARLEAGLAEGADATRQDRRALRDLMNAQATGLASVWDNDQDEAWDRV